MYEHFSVREKFWHAAKEARFQQFIMNNLSRMKFLSIIECKHILD